MTRALSLTLLVVLAIAAFAQVAPPPTDDDIRRILIDRVDRAKDAFGIVVGIVDERGTRVVGYGRPSKDSTQTVNGDTVFAIGSVTKTVTATLLADMVLRGEVSLDDPISKYLPATVRAPMRNGREITLLDLATHTSSLPRDPEGLDVFSTHLLGMFSVNAYARKAYAPDRMLEFLSKVQLSRDIGTHYEYSNFGFAVLGYVLARRAETNYESLARTRVLDVLHMDDTRFMLSSDMERRLATGYDASLHADSRIGDIEWIAPEGGLYSTTNDLLKYAAANLGLTPTPLLDAMKMAQQARRDTDDNHWGMDFVALGWGVRRKYDPEIVWKNGAFVGYRSFVGFDSRHRRGVVVLWNSDNNLDDIGRHLLDTRYAVSRAHNAIALDAKSFDQYVGEYRSSPTFGLTVSREGKHFFVQGTGQKKSELFAESNTEFFEKGANTQVVFARDNSNGLTVTLYSQGLDVTFPKVH